MGCRGLRRQVSRRLPHPCEFKRGTKRAAPEIPGAARFFGSRNTPAFLGLILFPRSERPILDPGSIRTFWRQNCRKKSTKPQEMVPEKCRCFGGPILLVHFSGKVLDLNLQACRMSQKSGPRRGFSGAARLVSHFDSRGCINRRLTWRRKPRRPTSRAGRCCRGCAGNSCGSPRARARTGRVCRPPRRPRHRSRTAGR